MGGLLSLIINFFTGNEPPAPRIQGFSSQSNFHWQQTASIAVLQSATAKDEGEFFQLFFSSLDQIPEYRGIRRRWEVQREQSGSNNRYDMWKVWNERIGYVDTLQRVRKFVSKEKFKSHRSRLLNLSNAVVNRRENEYKTAKLYKRADPEHQTVLEAWRAVRDTLRDHQ